MGRWKNSTSRICASSRPGGWARRKRSRAASPFSPAPRQAGATARTWWSTAASPIAPISDRRGDTRGTAMPDVKRKVEVIRVNPQDWPDGTPAWKAEDPELGHDIIPAERYTSEAFMKLEWEDRKSNSLKSSHQCASRMTASD